MVGSNENDVDSGQTMRDAFSRALKYQEGQTFERTLKAGWLESPMGAILAVGDDASLYMLAHADQASLERKTATVQKKLQANIEMGDCAAIASITTEIGAYFAGRLRRFETPVELLGTSFQIRVWEELRNIPYGGTISYADLAQRMGKPAAFRAVAQASAQNPLAIVVPCHRVINADGAPGGYNAGVERKRWLLEFEQGVASREDK